MSLEDPVVQSVQASLWNWSEVQVADVSYERLVIRTRWLAPEDDLADVLRACTAGFALPGDTIVVSEKVALLLTGRSVPMERIQPGTLATSP
jgi:F420-0:gamma-glutamyl ligase